MRTLAAAILVLAISVPFGFAAEDPHGLAQAFVQRIAERKGTIAPQTHTTDFQSTELGCIALTTSELRRFGYRGHAFFCEDAGTGEILGAVLSRRGAVRCRIDGAYVGDACYSFNICGFADSACIN